MQTETSEHFDQLIQTSFVALAEADFPAAVSSLVQAESVLNELKKADKLLTARRRSRDALAASATAARSEVLEDLRRKVLHSITESTTKCRDVDEATQLWSAQAWLAADSDDKFLFNLLRMNLSSELESIERQLASELALSSLAKPAGTDQSHRSREEIVVQAVVRALSASAKQMQHISQSGTPSGPRVRMVQTLYAEFGALADPIVTQCIQILDLPSRVPAAHSQQTPNSSEPSSPVGQLASIDLALDQSAFVLQAVERYLRLVSSYMMLGDVGQPSSLEGDLPTQAQRLMGHFVQCEQAFVSAQIEFAMARSHPAEIESGVHADSWVDMVFFVLRQSVSRCASTYSIMTAAAALNHVVGLIEDQVWPNFNLLLELCTHSHFDDVPSLKWLTAEQTAHESGRDTTAARDVQEAAVEDGSSHTTSAGHSASSLTLSGLALRSMNSSALVVAFSSQLSELVERELCEIFASQQVQSNSSTIPCKLGSDSVLQFGIQQMADAAHALHKEWEQKASSIVRVLLHQPLLHFDRALHGAKFDIPSEDYDAVLSRHDLFRLFEAVVFERSGFGELLHRVSVDVRVILGKFVAEMVDEVLFRHALRVRCNELGGMYMHTLVRDTCTLMEQRGLGASRIALLRTLHSVAVLSSSSVDEAAQLFFATPVLHLDEIKALLHHRTDLLAPDVEQADFSCLNLVS